MLVVTLFILRQFVRCDGKTPLGDSPELCAALHSCADLTYARFLTSYYQKMNIFWSQSKMSDLALHATVNRHTSHGTALLLLRSACDGLFLNTQGTLYVYIVHVYELHS